jgi:hypothetical protein
VVQILSGRKNNFGGVSKTAVTKKIISQQQFQMIIFRRSKLTISAASATVYTFVFFLSVDDGASLSPYLGVFSFLGMIKK